MREFQKYLNFLEKENKLSLDSKTQSLETEIIKLKDDQSQKKREHEDDIKKCKADAEERLQNIEIENQKKYDALVEKHKTSLKEQIARIDKEFDEFKEEHLKAVDILNAQIDELKTTK